MSMKTPPEKHRITILVSGLPRQKVQMGVFYMEVAIYLLMPTETSYIINKENSMNIFIF